ncbi:acylphosphatase [Xanthobacter sp. ZOL 2024]
MNPPGAREGQGDRTGDRTIVRVTVRGRVQGVGYRAWCADEARRRGLSGWVRNRASGTVEALLAGEARQVAQMVEACRRGPHGARVDHLALQEVSDAVPAADAGFAILATL